MFQNIRWGTYVFFAALNIFLIFPVVYFYFPETKGKSLEEVRSAQRFCLDLIADILA